MVIEPENLSEARDLLTAVLSEVANYRKMNKEDDELAHIYKLLEKAYTMLQEYEF